MILTAEDKQLLLSTLDIASLTFAASPTYFRPSFTTISLKDDLVPHKEHVIKLLTDIFSQLAFAPTTEEISFPSYRILKSGEKTLMAATEKFANYFLSNPNSPPVSPNYLKHMFPVVKKYLEDLPLGNLIDFDVIKRNYIDQCRPFFNGLVQNAQKIVTSASYVVPFSPANPSAANSTPSPFKGPK